MKIITKWIVFLILCIGSTSTFAQMLNEGFEGSFLPEEWTLLNYGDDNTFISYSSITGSHSGSKCTKISYSSTAHNDWLITPKLTISNTTDSIHFWAKNQSATFLEEFHVKVSTSGVDTASFSTLLLANVQPGSAWEKYSFGLEDYVSQDIHIAIQSISTDEYGLFLDDFSGPNLFIPSCSKVESISANSVNSSGGNFSWPAIVGVQGYLVEVYEQGVSPSISTPVFTSNIMDTSIIINGLNSITDYSFYVKTICSNIDSSDSRSINFTTTCASYSTLSEDFEITTDLPECWSIIDNASSSYGSVKAVTYSSPAFGNKHLRLYNGSSSTAKQFAITPNLTDLANGTHRIRFMAKNGADEKLVIGTFSNPDDENTFNSIDTLELTNSETEYTINFPTTLTDEYIGFHLFATSSYKKVFIDEVYWEEIPSCVQPTSISLVEATSSSLSLSWDNFSGSENFEIQYGLDGFTFGSGIILNPTDSFEVISSLLAGTTYDIFVRSICSISDTSQWTNKFTFTTLCEPSLEVLENFEQIELNQLPNCWTSIVNSSTGSPYIKTVNTGSPANGDQQISLYNSSAGSNIDLVLVSPEMVSLNNKRIKLFARGGGQLKLGSLSDPNDISTFQALDSVDIVTVSAEYEFLVPSANGYFYGFKIEPTTSYTYSYIDSVRITALPTCIEPNEVGISIVSETEVEVSWNMVGSESDWIIEYGQKDFIPGTGQTIITSTNPTVIGSLNYGDTLDFYIKGICAVGDTSSVSEKGTFIMECAPITGVLSEDFTSYLPNCWLLAKGELQANSILEEDNGTTAWSWKEDGYLNTGTTGAARMNVYGLNAKHWLISPSINLEMGHNKTLKFDAGLTDFNNGNTPDNGSFGPDDKVVLVISTDNGLSWSSANALLTFDTNNAPSHLGEHYTVDISAYSGLVKFGFYGESTVNNEDNDFFIDNFEISEDVFVPLFDISLTTIDMDENYCFNEMVIPMLTVKNLGDQIIPEYEVEFNILGPQVLNLNQTISTPLNVLASNQISFGGIPNLPSGLYAAVVSVTIPSDTNTLNNGLTFSFSVEIPEVLEINNDTVICEGESLILQASGSNQLVWNGNISNGSMVSPSETTTYTVTGTSVNGCEQVITFTVTVNPLPEINIELIDDILTVEGGYSSYSWKFGGVEVSTDSNITISENGLYSVEVTNENGCSSQLDYTVDGLGGYEINEGNDFYPNPTSGIINITEGKGKQVSVYNLSGLLVFKTTLISNSFSIAHLSTGVYLVKIKKEDKLFISKINKL